LVPVLPGAPVATSPPLVDGPAGLPPVVGVISGVRAGLATPDEPESLFGPFPPWPDPSVDSPEVARADMLDDASTTRSS
jgi:hypothetical protein